LEELVDHFESDNWLIHWNHVTSVENSEEGEIISTFDFTGLDTFNVVRLELVSLIFSLVFPFHVLSPCNTTTIIKIKEDLMKS